MARGGGDTRAHCQRRVFKRETGKLTRSCIDIHQNLDARGTLPAPRGAPLRPPPRRAPVRRGELNPERATVRPTLHLGAAESRRLQHSARGRVLYPLKKRSKKDYNVSASNRDNYGAIYRYRDAHGEGDDGESPSETADYRPRRFRAPPPPPLQ